MKTLKKPYEISLWEEQLVWHRRKLELIEITSKDDYKRGAYYVKSDAQGADSYELSYEDYRDIESQKANPYYQLIDFPTDEDGKIIQKDGDFKESYDSDDIQVSPISAPGWYEFKKTTDTERDNNKIYYTKDGENWVQVAEGATFSEDWYEASPKPQVITSFYKETRLCTIGSNTMDSPARAVNGKLVRKVNGEVTFTFTMYYRYFDNQTGQLEYNPFVPYLTNERKVKLKHDGEWYDLIIKQIQENSESKAFTYTCKSQFVNELSKTGFELEFDNELENNMGTVDYLAEQILEGSDWQLETSETLKQFIEEPLYRITLGQEITARDMETNKEEDITAGQKIYAFYSQINDKKTEIQFLFANTEVDENGDNKFIVNDDLVIDKKEHPNYIINNVEYDEKGWPDFVQYNEETGSEPIALAEISTKYRGMRLVKQARTVYDAKIDKYVQEYTKTGTDTVYYGLEETKYLSPNAVNNYIVNPNAFTSTTGWYVQPNAQGAKATLELVSDPPFTSDNIGDDNINFTSYLKFPNNGGALVNSSINSHKSSLEGFVEGETTYVLRIKCKEGKSDTSYIAPKLVSIYQYENMTSFNPIKEIFTFTPVTISSTNEQEVDDKFIYYKAISLATVTEKDFKNWDNHYGLFLSFDKDQYTEVYIEDIQLFPYVLDEDQRLCVPGGELFAKVETTKKYYNPSQEYSSLEEIEFEPAQPEGTYLLKYAEGTEAYTKVSSITAKESNRFNLLQDLNEKFECWARFRVEHNEETGEILYGKDKKWYDENGKEIECPENETYRQQKFISFHEYAGTPNPVGFKYGINSKSIQRTLDSNAIVSKMIVKDNANEFARNGFCSIARAVDNSSKENFVLNFDHYYRHRLLDLDIVTNDLYVASNGYLGYYKQLKEINQDRDALVEKQANLLKEIANYEAQYQTYKTSYDSAVEERNQMEDNIFLLIVPKESRDDAKGLDFPNIISTYSAGWEENSSYIKYTTSWIQCDNVIKQHLPLYQKAEEYLRDCENQYKEITETLKTKAEQKRALNLQFYKKYSRFIQEGSWIKEDYVDDNLYYLDSLSTLHTSAQPKVTYNISVVDVSPLPGYEDYDFKLGDITYIEDREFFGYSLIDGTTPYREEIVVSEITTELDAPEKNSIKVQNYKTQFEDLFQRITAQTQQAEYHTGEYKRAASIVEPGGSISASTLENSFANNSFKLSNVRDQSVIIDSSGITTTSLANPSEMLRIVNGGIFMSTDGGQSWKTGLTGYGLNSSYLTAGQINTDEIYIMSGNQPAFGWDEKGISAYALNGTSYDLDTCVRFDRHGIYGVKNNAEYTSVENVMDSAPFALTWNGFSLKNSDGSVKITSSDDIEVADNSDITRLKIGRLGTYIDEADNKEKTAYGIRISDQDGNAVMESDSEGELWLQKALIVKTTGYVAQSFDESEGFEDSVDYYEYNEEQKIYLKTNDTAPQSSKTYFLKQVNGNITIGEREDTVINAANNFVVYNDGTVYANGGTFFGTINAGNGMIGNLLLENSSLTAQTGKEFAIRITEDGNVKDVITLSSIGMSIYGVINAQNGGNIGGFTIKDGALKSEHGGIQLNGNGNGEIIADTIQLGTGANIKDYLLLGSARIQNPQNPNEENDNDRPFIYTDGLEIYQDGNIIIKGLDSGIFGNRFSITSETARFQNIVASGTIETAVFKQGSIQAAGGAMVFAPSYKIEAVEQNLVTLDPAYQGNVGDTVWLTARDETERKEAQISSITDGRVTLSVNNFDVSDYLYGTLIQIGQAINKQKPLVMGINSGKSNVWNHIRGRGLTIDEYGNDELPRLFLGDLGALEEAGLQGYGLYSDNVYLNGSLTTKTSTNGYAGVNTLNGVSGDSEIVGTDGKIIFWAGSQGTTDSAIQNAPFQVTEDGYVYLRNSLIAGGELRAATIRGWVNGEESALTIYDTAKGISFKTDDGNETELFTIGASGLKTESGYFIKMEDGQALLKTKGDNNYIALQEYESRPALFHHHSDSQWCGLFFDNNETSFEFNVGGTKSTAAIFSNNSVKFKQNVEMGSGLHKMQYKAVNNGYDLYIVSEKEE